MENPDLIAGVPAVIIGLIGLFVALSLFAVPAEETAEGGKPLVTRGDHAEVSDYVVTGIALAGITAIEVALYYIDLGQWTLIGILLVLSAAKFGLVVGFFMHLRYDSKLFSILFFGGLALAAACFTVAVATLDGNLI
jgi:cytochrome c oxidase subunit 4